MREEFELISRAEFQERVDQAQSAGFRGSRMVFAIAGGVFLLGLANQLGLMADLPDGLARALPGVFLAALAAGIVLSSAWGDRKGPKLGLRCPRCGDVLYGGAYHLRTIRVVSTGRCPRCGIRILIDPTGR